MTKEEKQKAIDALKISAPVRAMTQEEFNDYIQTLNKVIDWLEQEPCEDCISRKAVLEMAKSYNTDGWDMYTPLVVDVEDIEELPPVTPQEPRWIPIEGKLPEDGQSVLFCDIDHDIMIGYHIKGRPNTHFSQDGTYEDIKNVRAWMPLPEGYKESEVK